jgi:hypothetical protein
VSERVNWVALAAAAATVAGVEIARRVLARRRVAPGNPDEIVLAQLRAAGSDLSRAHDPEFFLYFAAEENARTACGRLEGRGFKVRLEPTPDDRWLCLATKTLVLQIDALTGLRLELSDLARQLDGVYDGWGSPVVR